MDVEIIAGVAPVIYNESPEFISGMPINTIHTVNFEKDILFDVLSIIKDIDIMKGFDEQNTQSIPTFEILDLCKKYGMLFSAEDSIWSQYKISGFTLFDFKHRLYSLYWRFVVYMAVYKEDYDLMRRVVPSSCFMHYDKKVPTNKEILATTQEWLINQSNEDINVSLCLNKNRFGLETSAKDIISACNILLSLMIAMGEGKNINMCSNCYRFFVGRKNKKYCLRCNRKTIHSRNKRKGGV